jgi:hypothetical protein
MPDLSGMLSALQDGCRAATAAVAARYFRQSAAVEWRQEGQVVPALVDPSEAR